FNDPLPIGIFADRAGCLTADNVQLTPEPGTILLLGLGMVGMLLGRRKFSLGKGEER
ncbi:MAG: PEP-CTERM sorting domain-containing protein, partial [Deltaproteobacteria bacterium]|nr:PEP-CTERM sorting domain-containing protein [Deltaproteobacteria bacterium]